jgi:hypothetical protein
MIGYAIRSLSDCGKTRTRPTLFGKRRASPSKKQGVCSLTSLEERVVVSGVINGKGEAIHPMPLSSPAHSYRQFQMMRQTCSTISRMMTEVRLKQDLKGDVL